jgi:hypothetical protein
LYAFSISPFSYSKAFHDKEIKLKEHAANKKIVFIGGSNLAYGIHSDLIQKKFPDYLVFNMGLHAGIGLKTMIDQVWPYIGPQDIIIVAPEYEQFIDMFYGNSSGMYLEVLADQPRFIKKISINSIPIILEAFPTALQKRFQQFVRSILNKDVPPKIYSRRAFNAFGDVVSHKSVTTSRVDMKEYENSSYKDVKFTNKRDAIRYLNKFQNYIMCRGASMYIAYPAFMASIWPRTQVQIDSLNREIVLSGLKPLYEPKDAVMPDSLFLDTSYHLLYTGSEIRTGALVNYMSRRIGWEHDISLQ